MLDANYFVAKDSEEHFKIAAVHRILERNRELEDALSGLDKLRDSIGDMIGKVL